MADNFSYRVPPPIAGYNTSDPIANYIANNYKDDADQRNLVKWINRMYREGMTTLATEPAWPHIQKSIDYIYKTKKDEIPEILSQLSIPQVEHDVTEIVSTYANFRPIPDFQAPNELKDQVRILNDLYIDWYISNSADRWWKDCLLNAGFKGTGWISPRWTKLNMGVTGEGVCVLDNFDHKEVVPIQMGKDNDIQKAYGCIIVNEVPLARAHAMYPDKQHLLVSDRQAPTRVRRAAKTLRKMGSLVLGMFGASGKLVEENAISQPSIDIFHCYVKDQSLNMTGEEILVGGGPPLYEKNSWAYYVPSTIDKNGNKTRIPLEAPYQDPISQLWITDREVKEEECRIYPWGRLIIATRTAILWDGPNPYWHGRFPISKVTLRTLPDCFLGYPLTTPGPIEIERSINSLLRSIENSCIARLNPPMQSDDAIDENLAAKIIPTMPGQKWRINSLLGNGVTFPFPAEYYDVPDFIPKYVEFLYQKLKDILSLESSYALTQARQTPAADTLQKMLEMLGPIAEDRARSVEAAVVEIGHQMLYNFFQFYTFEKRMRVLGPDGASKEDKDYDPLTLVPAGGRGKTRRERAMAHINKIKFLVTPRSIHEINSMSRKMLYLQLQRGGFPIDSETVGKACDIPRLGEIPGDTVFEKYVNEQKAKIRVGIELQAEQAEKLQPFGGNNGSQLPQGAMQALQQLLSGGMNPNGHPGSGQPSSGQQPPQQVQKDGGTRTTVSESGR